MHLFTYRNATLHAEDVPAPELAEKFGTPLYVYSAASLRRHVQAYSAAFADTPHLLCFSVKANANIHILRLLGELGVGMDIVSGGELYRALAAGIPGNRIVYSGVGKRDDEIRDALKADILMFNVESEQELARINAIAVEMGVRARISLRINPDVDPKTHPYISTGLKKNKFGLDRESALATYLAAKNLPAIDSIGVDCHIGSQLTDMSPLLEALDKMLLFIDKLQENGINIKYLDMGGGIGIRYDEEQPPKREEYVKALCERVKGRNLTVILEPGRSIVGNAGILLTRAVYTKKSQVKDFVVVDAGMNDLVRPSYYDAFHRIAEVSPKGRPERNYDVVGPICESSDFLAKDRDLPGIEPGELLVAFSAGAYGFTMSSNYNARPRAAEVLVDGDTARLIRRRESYEDLIAAEKDL